MLDPPKSKVSKAHKTIHKVQCDKHTFELNYKKKLVERTNECDKTIQNGLAGRKCFFIRTRYQEESVSLGRPTETTGIPSGPLSDRYFAR